MEALHSDPPNRPTSVGDYTLGDLLGRGGMSEVYACAHPVHGNRLALKLLHDDADGTFHVEARTREVEHEHVVRVLDAGLDPVTHRYFLVMERLDGPDLATHLRRGPLDEGAARTLLAGIADGMHAVHTHGIVHRDLKPANVMLHAGSPRIVDFGIAKILGENAALVTSRRIGTLGYMAPEQLVGGMIAPSVDVWALGIMLFEAVTGRLPFDGFTESYTPQLVETAPRVRSIVDVSPAYDAIVAACLDPDPAKRPPMIYIARALRGEVAVETAHDERVTQDIGAIPPSSVPPSSSSPSPRSSSRRRVAWGVGGAIVIAAIAVVGGLAWRGGAKDREPSHAVPARSSDIAPASDSAPPAGAARAADIAPEPGPVSDPAPPSSAARPVDVAPRASNTAPAAKPRAKRATKPAKTRLRRETLD